MNASIAITPTRHARVRVAGAEWVALHCNAAPAAGAWPDGAYPGTAYADACAGRSRGPNAQLEAV